MLLTKKKKTNVFSPLFPFVITLLYKKYNNAILNYTIILLIFDYFQFDYFLCV